MSDENRIDPGHNAIRGLLRVVGPAMAIAGGVLTAIGFIDFFSSATASFSREAGDVVAPEKFLYAVVGLPLLAIGIAITKFAYLGRIARYLSEEVTTVATDTLNYVAEETQGGVEAVAGAISRGTRKDRSEQDQGTVCPSCGESNRADAKFCNGCGAALGKKCPDCGEANDPDAKFCDHCGKPMQ